MADLCATCKKSLVVGFGMCMGVAFYTPAGGRSLLAGVS